VTEADPNRDENEASTICGISFVSGNQRFTGELDLFAVGEPDAETARQEVASAPCEGTIAAVGVPDGLLAVRSCSFATSEKAITTGHAADGERRVTVRVSGSIRDDVAAATTYAQEVGRVAATDVLTLPEPE
jgi:hypothetical protein